MAALQRHSGSLKEKLQEEFLSCKICLESLRRPKALPCLHSFCESCLKDYVRRHPGGRPGYFPCPMCRKDTYIPHGGVEDFPDNFLLLSLSDTLLEDDDDQWSQTSLLDTSSSSSGLSSSFSSLQGPSSPPRHLYPPSPREIRHRDHEWVASVSVEESCRKACCVNILVFFSQITVDLRVAVLWVWFLNCWVVNTVWFLNCWVVNASLQVTVLLEASFPSCCIETLHIFCCFWFHCPAHSHTNLLSKYYSVFLMFFIPLSCS